MYEKFLRNILSFYIGYAPECLERQPSRFINIVGKDDISRQGEKAGQVERFRDIHSQSKRGAAATSHAPSVFIPQPFC